MRVLVVDGEPASRDELVSTLAEAFDVAAAGTGEEALDRARLRPPDLIVMETDLSGIDGRETARRIRAIPELRHARIVLTTASEDAADRRAGYAAGADDVVTRSIDRSELIDKIRALGRLKPVEELSQLKNGLLSIVSHELKTPLTAILPAARMLGLEGDMDEGERREWAQQIEIGAVRLLEIIEHRILLSEIETGERQLRLETVEFGAVLEASIERFTRDTREAEFFVRSRSLLVRADAELLSVALQAALHNAVATNASRTVSTELSERDGRAVLEITNVRDERPRPRNSEVFSMFSPLVVEQQVVGGELRLALARAILREHGGDIEFQVETPPEATLTLWLPRCDPDDPRDPRDDA